VTLTVGGTAERPVVERAGLLRTARILMEGRSFVPASALAAHAGSARHAAE
jgi:4-oxalomesaconate tautomerase